MKTPIIAVFCQMQQTKKKLRGPKFFRWKRQCLQYFFNVQQTKKKLWDLLFRWI